MKKIKKIANGLVIERDLKSVLTEFCLVGILLLICFSIITFTPILQIFFNKSISNLYSSSLVEYSREYLQIMIVFVLIFMITKNLIDEKIILNLEDQVLTIFYRFASIKFDKQILPFNSLSSMNFIEYSKRGFKKGSKELIVTSKKTFRKQFTLFRIYNITKYDLTQTDLLLKTVEDCKKYLPQEFSSGGNSKEFGFNAFKKWEVDRNYYIRIFKIIQILGIIIVLLFFGNSCLI